MVPGTALIQDWWIQPQILEARFVNQQPNQDSSIYILSPHIFPSRYYPLPLYKERLCA